MNLLMDWILAIAFIFIATASLLTFVRLMIGPSIPDRVIALDLLSSLGIGLTAAYAIRYKHYVFLDVSILVALISFLGTVAFAKYIERRN